jgi:hypothetical protein
MDSAVAHGGGDGARVWLLDRPKIEYSVRDP